MVGKAIKNYAQEKGMTIKNGVAFGVNRGFMMSMQEGSGWKSVSFAVRFDNENAKDILNGYFSQKEIKRDYRVSEATLSPNSVVIVFLDNPGTMKRIVEFIEIVCDKFNELGGKGSTYCSSCGLELDSSAVPVLMNDVVYLLHSSCLEKDTEEMNYINEEKKNNGSTVIGAVGAFVGAVIGAIPWAVAYYFGWFIAALGFVIGLASKKGYELLNGKENRAKGIIVIVATVFGVLLAEAVAIIVSIYSIWQSDPEFADFGVTIFDAAYTFAYALGTDPTIISDMAGDIALGLFFAGLGIWQTIRDIFKANGKNANKFIRLD